MQTAKPEVMSASGKTVVFSTTPNCDKVFLNREAPKRSVEYAKARTAINEDFMENKVHNVALAKRVRKESKHKVVAFLEGKVSKKWNDPADESKGFKYIVSFPDGSQANL